MIGLIEHTAPAPSAPDSAVIALTPRVFAPGGWLHDTLHLQHRPQQAAIGHAIAQAIHTDTPLLCEAGTGVGKSLAYLIPGLIHAIDTARQFVVATHTIPLQEQIQNNDLVKCRQLFDTVPVLQRYAKFKTALLVGKSNYLCATRLAKAITQHTEIFESTQQTDLRRIQEWALTTQTGLREELSGQISPEVWEWVNADSSACNSRNCSPKTCPYQRARARIADANIIIVNHALLLSLIAAGATPKKDTRGILYANDFVVLDEAHCLPAVATDHFGECVTAYAIEKQLKMLWNPKRGRGFLSIYNKTRDADLVTRALVETEFFFNEIRQRYLEKTSILRQRQPDWIEPRINEPLHILGERLADLAKIETEQARREELNDFRRRLGSLNSALNDAITLGNVPHYVYWVERTGARGQNVSVNSAPLDVADALRAHLFERKTSAILTSATLSDGTDMARFKKQTGAAAITDLIEKSPFDYRRNMEIYIAADAPAPDQRAGGARDTDWLASVATHCIGAVPGGTLLLCTSHGDVRKLHEHLTRAFDGQRRVLAQLAGTNRSQLVRDFRADGAAVLIGTDSFWTGVDVPGPALSQVIMTRLPFENPSHPIVEARTEWIEQEGKNPFAEMSVPAALIKFRQGLGRLIRKMDDRGRLVILDSRVLTKPYGRHFVAALPHSRFVRFRRENLAETVPQYR
ncbi:MAG: ATP-dependent DNA helicase [Puniceicoccales bacterium]|jgi:ATP-dependent DNA helicase DinG|nr:ATP-dependent DNA helicase [Puniceicoccales bacterium]